MYDILLQALRILIILLSIIYKISYELNAFALKQCAFFARQHAFFALFFCVDISYDDIRQLSSRKLFGRPQWTADGRAWHISS
jgi:hypothetical protein